MEGKLKILGTNKKSEDILQVSLIFMYLGTLIAMLLRRNILELIRFYIGDLPMYTFFIPTHP